VKKFFTFLISLFTGIVFGQDTTFFDMEGNQIKSLATCHHYEIIERDASDTNKVVLRAYFKSGQMKSLTNYNPYSKKKLNGKFQEWFENGQIRKDMEYKDDNYDGNLLTYWENGQLKRKDSYKYGKLLEGKCWNAKGKEVKYFDYEVMPVYAGGEDDLVRYLGKKIYYPQKEKKDGIEGTVYIQFVIDKDGSVTNVRVLKGVSEGLDEEAARIVQSLPKWSPGFLDGDPVKVSFVLPIKFRLN
jgi:protein TonB